ncbi:MAG: hypothetical protein Q9168_007050 [Polycauliona sp. 1 TL-2023]
MELLRVIHTGFGVALSETQDFLQDAKQQVFDMTLQSRIKPSKEKFQHLLHLNDCTKDAEDHMTHNTELLGEVKDRLKLLVPVSDGSEEARLLDDSVAEIQDDLQYVVRELAEVGASIEKLRSEVLN